MSDEEYTDFLGLQRVARFMITKEGIERAPEMMKDWLWKQVEKIISKSTDLHWAGVNVQLYIIDSRFAEALGRYLEEEEE